MPPLRMLSVIRSCFCQLPRSYHMTVTRGRLSLLKLNNRSSSTLWSSASPLLSSLSTVTAMRKELDRSYYTLPNNTPVCLLDCAEAWTSLTPNERLYAHYLSRAAFHGSLIVPLQTSPESPYIIAFLQKLFGNREVNELRKLAAESCGFMADDFQAFVVYAAGIYNNMGNYRGFGDVKIVPAVEAAKVGALVAQLDDLTLSSLWEQIKGKMFSLDQRELRLGFSDTGVTTYFSENVSKQDAELVKDFMKAKKYEAWNSRLIKTQDELGRHLYDIRLASVNVGDVSPPEPFQDCLIKRSRGDYSLLLKLVVDDLAKAKEFAANDFQAAMIDGYIDHFTSGDIEDHKRASRQWIQDKGPNVENYIGFIENYRDPDGCRSEFEGFVAAVNKEMTRKFADLVDMATELLKLLPWDASYEKDTFLKPDFTSLDVISFGSSGIPAGINIPNYDEIRQSEGFKNVSLGNVIKAFPKTKIIFVSKEDADLIRKYHHHAFEVQVGLHELLGHGSGKMFEKRRDGSNNFDIKTVKDMDTGGPITSWYEEGETWGGKFGYLSSAFEECRAEAVGYCLSTYPHILKIFGHEGAEAETIKYINWLSELRAGLLGLEFYSPETQRWGQAHCHARWALLRASLEAGDGFVTLEVFTADDGKPDIKFAIDRSKIDTAGFEATMEFLKKLQLYKATANFSKGRELFDQYSNVSEEHLKWRDIVIARRQPRRLFVQCNTSMTADGKDVELQSYPETAEGIISSLQDRFSDIPAIDALLEHAHEDRKYHENYWN